MEYLCEVDRVVSIIIIIKKHISSRYVSARLEGSSPAAGLLLARRFGRYNKWDSCRRRGVRLFHQPWKPCAGQGTLISAATMNPPCGRCNKPVYPTEKINCLDKVREVIHRHSDQEAGE